MFPHLQITTSGIRAQELRRGGRRLKNPLTRRGHPEIAADSCVEGFSAWISCRGSANPLVTLHADHSFVAVHLLSPPGSTEKGADSSFATTQPLSPPASTEKDSAIT